jgi:hypothetical protein
MSIEKTFHGDLQDTSKGEMLSAVTPARVVRRNGTELSIPPAAASVLQGAAAVAIAAYARL